MVIAESRPVGERIIMSFYSNIVQHLDLALKGKDLVALARTARDAVMQTVDFLFAKKGVERDMEKMCINVRVRMSCCTAMRH